MDYQELMMAANAPNIPQVVSGNGLGSILGTMSANSAKNTAQSQAFAREQMAFQEQMNAKAMEFNSEQARLNREWQEMMSNTAHQREVADLKAAGLNPILSATGGNGASVTSGASASVSAPSGAKGDVDESINAALASVFGSILNSQTQLQNTLVSAKSQEAIADKYTAMSHLIETMQESFAAAHPSNMWSFLSGSLSGLNDMLLTGEMPDEPLLKFFWILMHPDQITAGGDKSLPEIIDDSGSIISKTIEEIKNDAKDWRYNRSKLGKSEHRLYDTYNSILDAGGKEAAEAYLWTLTHMW